MEQAEITEWVARCQHQLLRSAYNGDQHRAGDRVRDALVKVALRW